MTEQPSSLDPQLVERLRDLCQEGYRHYDQEDYKAAIRSFFTAWTQIPKPQTRWQESGWVLTALGDAYFKKGDFKNAHEALNSALHCPKTLGNPFVHLRLGQCLFEQGHITKARHQFQLVIDNEGIDLFNKEPEQYYQALIGEQSSDDL